MTQPPDVEFVRGIEIPDEANYRQDMKNKKKMSNMSLLALLVILFALLYGTERSLRQQTGHLAEERVSDADKSIERGWDKIAFHQVLKLFIPKWQEDILAQERIIENNKDDPKKTIEAYLKIAEIYEKQGMHKEAGNTCNKILKEYALHPLRKKAYLKLASVYEKEKRFTEARKVNEIFLQEFPDDFEAVKTELKNIVIHEREGNYRKAIEGYKEFLTKYPKTKEKDHIAFRIGLLYQTLGQPDKAAEFYEGIVWDKGSIWGDNARAELWLKRRAGGLSKKLIHAYKTDTPPRIDGRLNDPAWEKGDKVTGFVDTWKNVPVKQQTIVTALYDEKNLYIAFNCLETRTFGLIAKCTVHDGNVWSDDCIEIFLDTNRDYTTYYHLLVNPIGTKRESKKVTDTGWNPGWKVATAIGPNHWNVEVAIPFKDLDTSTPLPGTAWGVNFNRARRAAEKEISGWSFMDGNHHHPERFGYLAFK